MIRVPLRPEIRGDPRPVMPKIRMIRVPLRPEIRGDPRPVMPKIRKIRVPWCCETPEIRVPQRMENPRRSASRPTWAAPRSEPSVRPSRIRGYND